MGSKGGLARAGLYGLVRYDWPQHVFDAFQEKPQHALHSTTLEESSGMVVEEGAEEDPPRASAEVGPSNEQSNDKQAPAAPSKKRKLPIDADTKDGDVC